MIFPYQFHFQLPCSHNWVIPAVPGILLTSFPIILPICWGKVTSQSMWVYIHIARKQTRLETYKVSPAPQYLPNCILLLAVNTSNFPPNSYPFKCVRYWEIFTERQISIYVQPYSNFHVHLVQAFFKTFSHHLQYSTWWFCVTYAKILDWMIMSNRSDFCHFLSWCG